MNNIVAKLTLFSILAAALPLSAAQELPNIVSLNVALATNDDDDRVAKSIRRVRDKLHFISTN